MTAPAATTPAEMERRLATARGIANAMLYEGYVLYPYHARSAKNHPGARFQWGVAVPPSWRVIDPSERCVIRTELVVAPGAEPRATVVVRFLRLVRRALEVADDGAPGGFGTTDEITVGKQVWMAWDEAVEERVDLGTVYLLPLAGARATVEFSFPASRDIEVIPGEPIGPQAEEPGAVAGRIIRTTEPIEGVARLRAEWADGPGVLVKLTIEVENTTPWSDPAAGREEALRRSLVAVHTLAAADDASFCSLLDPPEGAEAAVAGCRSEGSYPVLIGESGATDVMLAPPIILYDYPAVAPESPGDFHDGLEIDEILALRVLTLTEQEKAEARATDPRARAIVDRCDGLLPGPWDRLHGVLRDVPASGLAVPQPESADPETAPWDDEALDRRFDPFTGTVTIEGTSVGRGSRVRLHPTHRADVHDMFLAGQTATVAGVFHDVDGGVQVAVTIDGDPAAELNREQGRFRYFHPDEVEPLAATDEGAGKGDVGVAPGAPPHQPELW